MPEVPNAHEESIDQWRRERQATHHEMTQAFQQPLTTLRGQAKAMDGVSDQAPLLTEMKKQQQLTDTLLETMIE